LANQVSVENAYHRGAITASLETMRRESTRLRITLQDLLDNAHRFTSNQIEERLVTLETCRMTLGEELQHSAKHVRLLKDPATTNADAPALAGDILKNTLMPPAANADNNKEGGN